VYNEFSNNDVFAALFTGGQIAVPGVAGPPEPLVKPLLLVNTAGDVSAQDAVVLELNKHILLVSVCKDSDPLAPPLPLMYTR
jgi:hypothetical protein